MLGERTLDIDNAEMKYRRASIVDIEVLVEFRIRFLNESDCYPEGEETDSLKKALRGYFSRAIPSNEFVGWIAEYNGKILATGGMVVWQMPGRYGFESGKSGYVCNMYTAPEARRLGISTRLLAELIKEAESLGVGYLHLRAHKDAIDIYRKAGFAEPHHLEMQLKLEQ